MPLLSENVNYCPEYSINYAMAGLAQDLGLAPLGTTDVGLVSSSELLLDSRSVAPEKFEFEIENLCKFYFFLDTFVNIYTFSM